MLAQNHMGKGVFGDVAAAELMRQYGASTVWLPRVLAMDIVTFQANLLLE